MMRRDETLRMDDNDASGEDYAQESMKLDRARASELWVSIAMSDKERRKSA